MIKEVAAELSRSFPATPARFRVGTRVVPVFLVAAVGAACGGSSNSYAVEPTAACLRESGATSVSTQKDDLDYIAAAAREGAVRAEVKGTEVHVVFERNGEDADDTAKAYEMFNVDGESLARKGNAVIAWSSTPTDEERNVVEDCLSE